MVREAHSWKGKLRVPSAMAAEKVLIVDDDDDILLIVQTILTSAGYSTLSARNGREGVDMALEFQPDLILLDVMMPEPRR